MVVKGGTSHIRTDKSVFEGYGFPVILLGGVEKRLRIAERRTTEAYAFFLCLGNAFGLADTYVFALVFGNKGKDLQYDIGDEFSHERAGCGTRVQKRHIEDEDIRPNFIGDTAPFFGDHGIVSAPPVNGLDDEQVAALEFAYKAQVVLPFEVFSAYLVAEDMFRWDAEGTESGQLPVEVLVARGDAGVSIGHESTSVFYESIADCKEKRERTCGGSHKKRVSVPETLRKFFEKVYFSSIHLLAIKTPNVLYHCNG